MGMVPRSEAESALLINQSTMWLSQTRLGRITGGSPFQHTASSDGGRRQAACSSRLHKWLLQAQQVYSLFVPQPKTDCSRLRRRQPPLFAEAYLSTTVSGVTPGPMLVEHYF